MATGRIRSGVDEPMQRVASEAPAGHVRRWTETRHIRTRGGRSGPERGALRGCWCGLRYTEQADPGCYRCRTPHGRERQRTEGACTRLLSAPPPFPTAGNQPGPRRRGVRGSCPALSRRPLAGGGLGAKPPDWRQAGHISLGWPAHEWPARQGRNFRCRPIVSLLAYLRTF